MKQLESDLELCQDENPTKELNKLCLLWILRDFVFPIAIAIIIFYLLTYV